MDKVVNLKSKKDEKLKTEVERLREKGKLAEIATGVIYREDERKFDLQGTQPSFEIHMDDQITNLNYFSYLVDNQLIIDGWNPCGCIPFDKNYFKKRKKTLSFIGGSNIKEKRSEYRDSGKPCVVIYAKD